MLGRALASDSVTLAGEGCKECVVFILGCMSSPEDREQLIIITKLSKHPIPLIFSLKCNRQIKSGLSLERSETIPVGMGQVSLCPVAVPELLCGHWGREQWFLRAQGFLSTYF